MNPSRKSYGEHLTTRVSIARDAEPCPRRVLQEPQYVTGQRQWSESIRTRPGHRAVIKVVSSTVAT